tara:strand:+ start:1305 stop:2315 length:1011 start_codon:yes stop_codon:yes gene_type:complete
MSCGLGAIILVFMLVKHNVDKTITDTRHIEADLERLIDEKTRADQELFTLKSTDADLENSLADLMDKIQQAKNEFSNVNIQLEALGKIKAVIKREIAEVKIQKPPDIMDTQQVNEENYLIGLKVQGPKIAILVDASASMTDEKLLDIIRRKNSAVSQRLRGPKWQRTLKAAKWLIARVPQSSQVMVGYYNERAERLHDQPWISGKDREALSKIVRRLDQIDPQGATNLEIGIKLLQKVSPTDLYLITDGLPTSGSSSYKSLNPFSACNALWGQGSKISGECRAKLFAHTLATNSLSRTKVNVVLLPLEGDPEAGFLYWNWAAASGGLLISPASSWP